MNTEQERAELLPCPFCGEGKDLIVQHHEGTIIHPAYRIYCGNCGASNGYSDRVDPVKNWNSRSALQSQDREAASTAVDASMEAVRKQFCALPRYSFITRKGGVSRVHDRTGNWIEFDQAHALFDPINVDHARRVEGDGDAI